MFRSIQIFSFFNVERIWFSNQGESQCDLIRYVRASEPLYGNYIFCSPSETVITDLTDSIENIIAKCTKTVKYEVNKCMKEGVIIERYPSALIKKDPVILNEFEKVYMDFANDLHNKELLKAYNRKKVESFIDSGCLLIVKAVVESVSVYHVYAYGDKECCLLYSVSNFREDSSMRNLAGRTNKLLHIKDIEFFKENGLVVYDWGNISSSENPNGIDVFKMSFGGKVCTLYNISKGNSVKGNLIVLLQKLINKL